MSCWLMAARSICGQSVPRTPIASSHSTLACRRRRCTCASSPPSPTLSQQEVERFTHVDHDSRVVLVAELGDRLVGVARYDREPGTDSAEVAFVISDEHQGRGIGTALLEHLAAAARERGITRFVAQTLARNHHLLGVLRAAGFAERTRLENDVVYVELLIEPTDRARAAIEAREHRAEATSVARLLTPRSVALIGASRNPASVGHQALRNLLAGGFAGPVYPVNPGAEHVASVKAYPTVLDIPGSVDLAVIAVPAASVIDVVLQCAAKGRCRARGAECRVRGGRRDRSPGRAARRLARRNGMRLVGPNCIGVVNTAIGLDATFSPYAADAWPCRPAVPVGRPGNRHPRAVRADRARACRASCRSATRPTSAATICSSTGRTTPALTSCCLYLESFGNPRKFARIARRVSRRKPIVAVKSGRSAAGVRAASSHTAAMASPDIAVDALFRQSGVIRVDTLDELFDMALVLDSQPLPAGNRVAIVDELRRAGNPRDRRLRWRGARGTRAVRGDAGGVACGDRRQRRGVEPRRPGGVRDSADV